MGSNWSSIDFISNLTNGVSQQPPRVRQDSQIDVGFNVDPKVHDHIGRRPPLEVEAELEDMATNLDIPTNGYPYTHCYIRDSAEKYVIALDGVGGLFVNSLIDGTAKTVTITSSDTYLEAPDPEKDFFAWTYKDTTFILNRSVVAQMNSSTSAARTKGGLIVVKDYVASATYSVTVKIGVSTFTVAPTGASVSAVASDIVTKLMALVGWGASGLSATSKEHVVYISHATTDFTVQVSDNRAGTAIRSFYDKILKTSELPPYAPHGYLVQVTSNTENKDVESNSSSDSQYYKFISADGATFGEGKWAETIAPGIKYQINAATMPHKLVRTGVGTFELDVIDWGDREVGDEFTNPNPLFIGQKINHIYSLANRFGLLAGSTFYTGRTGEEQWFEMFRQTTLQRLDDDPVYGIIPSSDVNTCYWAIPKDGEMVILGDRADGVVGWGTNSFSQQNITITAPTRTGVSSVCPPILMDSQLFFVKDNGAEWSNLGSYQLDPNTGARVAEGITDDYLSRYITGDVKRLAGREKSHAVILSRLSRSKLFSFTYSKKAGRLVQQAVVEWDFTSADVTILDVVFDKSTLYMIYESAGNFLVGRLEAAVGAKDTGWPGKCLLDNRQDGDAVSVFGAVYDALTDRTELTMPIVFPQTSQFKVVVANTPVDDERYAVGETLTVELVVGDTVTIKGDLTDLDLFIGYDYDSYFELNPIFNTMTNPAKGVKASNVFREINLSKLVIGFFRTQFLEAKIFSRNTGNLISSREFRGGLQLDNIQSILDDNGTTYNGTFSVDALNSRASQIRIRIGSSGSHLPWFVDTVAWLANVSTNEI